jgi:hypothetical protein
LSGERAEMGPGRTIIRVASRKLECADWTTERLMLRVACGHARALG